ncbi:MAG: Protease synthase and sporulation protein PAI 2 [Catillopecten margaritatus gill symbiont]|uniref:Protease synthase and sporulation protein PAI 2 n=1 Tax=Catillopecten margaritatus gill symbiont TaxID=3083288 RepID=A0AAU6PHA7_9GAMM
MYITPPFDDIDNQKVNQFLRSCSFVTIVSSDNKGEMLASHLSIDIVNDGSLHGKIIGHLAIDNPHFELLKTNKEVLTIFQSDSSYISPSWTEKRTSVPTQSFMDIHTYGTPTIIMDKKRIHEILEVQVNSRESRQKNPWSSDELPNNAYDNLLNKIVAFEISIERLRVNFHLLQNKPIKDIVSILKNDEISDDLKNHISSINKL